MKIIITGGGTGGHYYPASLIAQNLINEKHQVFFLGNENYIEKNECEKNNIAFIHIPSRSTSKKNLQFLLENIKGIKVAMSFMIKNKPDVIYSTGGFTTAPVVAAATLLKIPVILHEQNAVVGLVQKLFRKKAALFIHSFPNDVKNNEKLIGNVSRYNENLSRTNKKIIFLGGSGGAKFVNSLALQAAKHFPEKKFLLLSGRNHDETASTTNIEIIKYTDNILEIYADADLVIARAGSTTLAELSSLGIPSIIIPMPNSADNHQVKNAEFYSSQGAIIQANQGEYTENQIFNLISSISEEEKKRLSKKNKDLYNQEIEKSIINEIEKVIAKKQTYKG